MKHELTNTDSWVIVFNLDLVMSNPFKLNSNKKLRSGIPFMIVSPNKQEIIDLCYEKYFTLRDGSVDISGFDEGFYTACIENDVNEFNNRIEGYGVDYSECDHLGLRIAKFYNAEAIINTYSELGVDVNTINAWNFLETIKVPRVFQWDVGYHADGDGGVGDVIQLIHLAKPEFFVSEIKHPNRDEWATPFQQYMFDSISQSEYKTQLEGLSANSISKGNRKNQDFMINEGWL